MDTSTVPRQSLLERRESNLIMNQEFLRRLSLSHINEDETKLPEVDSAEILAVERESCLSSITRCSKLKLLMEDNKVRKVEVHSIIEYLSTSVPCDSLVVYGDPGQGKTRLCQGALSLFPDDVAVCITCGLFDNRKDLLSHVWLQIVQNIKFSRLNLNGDNSHPKICTDISDLIKFIMLLFRTLPNHKKLILFFDDVDSIESSIKGLLMKILDMSAIHARLKIVATTSYSLEISRSKYNFVVLHSLTKSEIRAIIHSKASQWIHDSVANLINSDGFDLKVKNYIDSKLSEVEMTSNHVGFIWSAIESDIEQAFKEKDHNSCKQPIEEKQHQTSASIDFVPSLPSNLCLIILAGFIISKSSPDTDYDKLSGTRQAKRSKHSLRGDADNNSTTVKRDMTNYPFSLERLLSVFLVLTEANNKSISKDSLSFTSNKFTGHATFFANVSSVANLGYFTIHRAFSIDDPVYTCCVSSSIAMDIAAKYPAVQGFLYEYGS